VQQIMALWKSAMSTLPRRVRNDLDAGGSAGLTPKNALSASLRVYLANVFQTQRKLGSVMGKWSDLAVTSLDSGLPVEDVLEIVGRTLEILQDNGIHREDLEPDIDNLAMSAEARGVAQQLIERQEERRGRRGASDCAAQ
jgi:hypothetical protein